MALVIKSWKVDESAADGNLVKIVGREPGLISWLLSLVGIDATTTFVVTSEKIIYEQGSWQGQTKMIVPLRVVTRSYYGYTKPWKESLAIAVVASFVLTALTGFGGIFGPIAGIVYYFLNKNISFGFVEMSAWSAGISFKRSVIEGQNIDEKQAEKILTFVQKLIDKKTKGD